MRNSGPLKLNIRDKDLLSELEATIVSNIREAVMDSKERDSLLREYDDQLQGLTGFSGRQPWRDSCDLDIPITRSNFLTLHAMAMLALSRRKKILIEGVTKEDKESAQILEPYMSAKMYEAGYNAALADVLYNLFRWPVSILHCSYTVKTEDTRYTGYKPVTNVNSSLQDDGVVEEQFREEDVEYEEVPMIKPGDVVYEGLELRAVDTPDFYLYPATATDLQPPTANMCCERMLMTVDQLISNIDNWELDEEKLWTMIAKGSPGGRGVDGSDYRSIRDQRDGIVDGSGDAGFYEMYVCYTRMPILFDGDKLRTPRYLLQDDFICISCPQYETVLRLDFSPFGNTRPYDDYRMFKIPNAFYGMCIPILLDSLQAEANANIQYTVNCMNLELTPAFWIPKNQDSKQLENFSLWPGRTIQVQNPKDIVPIQTGNNSRDGFAFNQMLKNEADQLLSGGFNQLTPKVRKAAEVEAVQHAGFTKFDDILTYIYMGVEQTYRHAASLLAENMADDGEFFIDENDNKQHITPQMLKSRFIFEPVANSTNTDPETRIAYDDKRRQVVNEYLALLMNPQLAQRPDILKKAWHMAQMSLTDLNTPNIEDLIGKEPEEIVPPQAMPVPGLDLTPMPAMQPQQGVLNGAGTAPTG